MELIEFHPSPLLIALIVIVIIAAVIYLKKRKKSIRVPCWRLRWKEISIQSREQMFLQKKFLYLFQKRTVNINQLKGYTLTSFVYYLCFFINIHI